MFNERRSRWENYESPGTCYFIGGLIGGIGSIAGGLLGFSGSSKAAKEQAQAQQNQLNFLQNLYGTQQQQLSPFYNTGINALNQIGSNIGTPGSPGTLTATAQQFGGLPQNAPAYNMPTPTLSMFQQSPGYQWQLGQGVAAIQNAAGPTQGLLSGNTLNSIQSYGQGLANQDWWNWLTNYQNNYNTAYQANNQNYWNELQLAAANQANMFNRYATLAGQGQNAATLTGPQVSLGGQIGNTLAGVGSTNAAGTLGQFGSLASLFNPSAGAGSTALGSGISSIGNALNNYFGGGAGGSFTPYSLVQDFSGGSGGVQYSGY